MAESERGKGVARAMFDELRAQLPGREGFTFIRADNAVSRTFHASMGMREAATFTVAAWRISSSLTSDDLLTVP